MLVVEAAVGGRGWGIAALTVSMVQEGRVLQT